MTEQAAKTVSATNWNVKPPRFVAYWLGYRSKNAHGLNPSLEQIPDYVDTVIIAFALVRPGNVVTPAFMYNPPNTQASIAAGVMALRGRGKRVLLSVGGWGGNCWSNVTDPAALAQSIITLANTLHVDGIDIDYEGDNPLQDWMTELPCPNNPTVNTTDMLCSLIAILRNKLLAQGQSLTAVIANDEDYVTRSLPLLSWVQTMTYGSNWLYDSLAAAYHAANPLAAFVPYVLGVSWGVGNDTLQAVITDCSHKPPVGKLSMMLWDLSEDNQNYTGLHPWAFADAINANLPG